MQKEGYHLQLSYKEKLMILFQAYQKQDHLSGKLLVLQLQISFLCMTAKAKFIFDQPNCFPARFMYEIFVSHGPFPFFLIPYLSVSKFYLVLPALPQFSLFIHIKVKRDSTPCPILFLLPVIHFYQPLVQSSSRCEFLIKDTFDNNMN